MRINGAELTELREMSVSFDVSLRKEQGLNL
jgi:hypothetical protein